MTTSILVVEDDEMIREMMDVILSQAGYAVATAGGAEAALDLLKRTRFSLVLMDYQMPGMSGLDVIESLKRRGKALPPGAGDAGRAAGGENPHHRRLGGSVTLVEVGRKRRFGSKAGKILGAFFQTEDAGPV